MHVFAFHIVSLHRRAYCCAWGGVRVAEPAALGRLHQVQADYLRLTGPLLDIYPAEAGKIELLRAVAATAAQLGMNAYSDAPATDEAQKLLRECQFWVASR